tara:strand:+ start:1016 stop:1723 length:708 start_codon:yes stop_codon:yes gene_type:complete
MKKYIPLLLVLFIASCSTKSEITITKVLGSPEYPNAKISLDEPTIVDDDYEFIFNVSDYELGIQTLTDFDYNLANSGKGQHIHFIVNNGPYSAHYENIFSKKLKDSSNVILAFLSRSYHESVKNKNAFVLTQVGEKNIDLNNEFLFYSRPKGTYKGVDTEKLLLDFYLVNTEISANGNKVRATIQDKEFIIEEWAPYYIEGLPKGEIKIKLELIDASGNLIDSPFNPSNRTVILE